MTSIIIHRDSTASLDVDAQNCFTPLCPNELPVPHGTEIVKELNQQATLTRYRIGSKDSHPINPLWLATDISPTLSPVMGPHVDLRWPIHAVPGTFGFELIAGLPHPAEYDFFIWKGVEPDMHPYGNCYHDLQQKLSTGLIEFLRSKKITTLLVGGLATDHCVKITVLQLLDADFSVIVNRAACRGLTEESTKQAWLEMKNAGATIIQQTSELTAS